MFLIVTKYYNNERNLVTAINNFNKETWDFYFTWFTELTYYLLHSRFLSPPPGFPKVFYILGENVSAYTFWPASRSSRMLQSWYPYIVGCLHSFGNHGRESTTLLRHPHITAREVLFYSDLDFAKDLVWVWLA